MNTEPKNFSYSEKYEDNEFEYRHVYVTEYIARRIPEDRLMSEAEWRSLGVEQSPGWVHYMIHRPERHVLLFRRPLQGSQRCGTIVHSGNSVGVR